MEGNMWNDIREELDYVKRCLADLRRIEKDAQENILIYSEREQQLLVKLQEHKP